MGMAAVRNRVGKGSRYAAMSLSDPRALEQIGNRLVERGWYREAEDVFDQLLAISHNPSWCFLQAGRIAARLERRQEAVDRFEQALACEPPNVWAQLEKAIALQTLGADSKVIAVAFARVAEAPPPALSDGHFSTLMRAAHDAFRECHYDEALILYEFVVARGHADYPCRLRCADLHLLQGDAEEALRELDQIVADPEYDVWSEVTRARAFLRLGRYQDAVALLKAAVAQAPDNADFVRLLFTALEKSGDQAQLGSPDEFLCGLSDDQQFELQLRAKLTCKDYDGVALLYSGYPDSLSSRGARLVSETIDTLTQTHDFVAIDRLIESIGELVLRSPCLISSVLLAIFSQQDWERAEQLLKTAGGVLRETGDWELRHRKLQFLCFTLRLEEAEAFLAEWGKLSEVPEIASATVAGLYAALSRWDRILDLLRDRIRQRFPIEHHLFIEAVAGAARRTGEYTEVIALLSGALETGPVPALANFRDRLVAEVALLRSLGLRDPGDGQAAVPAIDNPLYAYRTRLLSAALDGAGGRDIGRAIYFCTDANYLVGTCVALFSLLRNNPGVARKHSLTVVCSDAVAAQAIGVFEEIAAAFSVTIRVRPSTSLLGIDYRFQTKWGLFTPGHGLSDAAYYRIFMAQRLIEEGIEGRALYLDSDTCIGPGIDDVLEFDLQGRPLGARCELPLPEIRRAAQKLGLDPETYFNSGVLLFDLSHPALPNALAHAVDVALHKHDMLTFVDQCALNIAFQDRTAMLPEDFNGFVRQTDTLGPVKEPVVWHYLAQPKPWDPMYVSVNCLRWVREFAALGRVVRPDRLRRLLAASFRQGPDCGDDAPSIAPSLKVKRYRRKAPLPDAGCQKAAQSSRRAAFSGDLPALPA